MLNDAAELPTMRVMMLDRIRRAPRRFGGRALAEDVAWTLSLQALGIVAVTASFLMLGRELGPSAYGEYVGLFAVTTPLSTVGHAAGLSVVQFTFREGRTADDASARFWGLVLMIGVVTSLIAIAVATWTLSLGLVEIVAVAVSELIVGGSIRVLAASQRAPAGVGGQMRVEIGYTLVRFAVLGCLFVTDSLTVRNLAIGWLVAFTAYMFVLVLVWLPLAGRRLRLEGPGQAEVTSVVQMGAPIFANNFQTNGDKIVLNANGLNTDAGHYGAAFRVASLAMVPIQSMESALFHRFLDSDDDALSQHTTRAVRYSGLFLAVVVPIAVVMWFMAPHFDILLGGEFQESETMIRWLTLWLPFQALSGVPFNALMGLGRFNTRLVLVMSSAALSMVMYVILIPSMGWEGAIVGTIISEIYLVTVGWIALLRAQRIHNAAVLTRM
jgi:O-antigen/teichoic acid export membrane protein